MNNLQKSIQDLDIELLLIKAKRDLTKLIKKVIVDKNGHTRVVYVKIKDTDKSSDKKILELVQFFKKINLEGKIKMKFLISY